MSRRIEATILGIVIWATSCPDLLAQVKKPIFTEFQETGQLRVGKMGCYGFTGGSQKGLGSFKTKPAKRETQDQINNLLKALGVEESILAHSSSDESLSDCGAIAFQDADHNHDWVIVYDPAFLESLDRKTRNSWAIMSVFAHEIGHHINSHTSKGQGSTPDREKQADYFSGHIMKMLGADLNDAQDAIKSLEKEADPATHPGKAIRLAEIKRGFDNASQVVVQQPASTPGGINPNGGVSIPSTPSETDKVQQKPGPSPAPPARTQPKMIWVQCLHLKNCEHLGPCIDGGVACQHPTPCTHNMTQTKAIDCIHPMACGHFGQLGLPLHPYDTIHPFDNYTFFGPIHAWDPAHPGGHFHPLGDYLHWGDPLHPDGHTVPAFDDRTAQLGYTSGSKPRPFITKDSLSIGR